MYNWQYKDWPNFRFTLENLQTITISFAEELGLVNFNELFNERQQKVINRMFEAGVDGFEGGMTAKKYMAIAKTSKATATLDLQRLNAIGALNVFGGGRSVRYELVF